MRKIVGLLVVLILLALVGGAAWVSLSEPSAGSTPTDEPVPAAEATDDAPTEPTTRDRVRVGRDGGESVAQDPADPVSPPPVAPVEIVEVDEAESGGVVLVTEPGTGTPAIGLDVAFLAFDPANPPDWAQGGQIDVFDAALEHGQMLRTGADGRVLVPAFDGFAILVARRSDARGQAWLNSAESDEWTLALQPIRSVAVQVVDSQGRPAAGVTVAVRTIDEDDDAWPLARATTDESGSARIEFDVPEIPEATFDVAALVPFGDAPSVAFDPSNISIDPLRLELTTSGSLRVEVVDDAGALWTSPVRVSVRAPRPDANVFMDIEDDPGATHITTEDGAALFPHVGVGGHLEVTVAAVDGSLVAVTESITGPETAGTEAACRIVVGAPRPVVVGKLVYEDGSPAAGVKISAELLVPGRESEHFWGDGLDAVTTDDGGFSFALSSAPGPGEKAALQIGRQVRMGEFGWSMHLVATIPLQGPLGGREHDLGTVEIKRPTLLASGRVVGPDGAPLRATVAAMDVMDWGRGPLDDVEPSRCDAQGAFSIEGTAEIDRVHLGATCDGYYLAEPVAVARGATEIVVRMSEAARLAGSVRIPDGMDPWTIQIFAEGDATDVHDSQHRGVEPTTRTQVEPSGAFELSALRPGAVSVSIRIGWNDNDTVLEVADLQVVAGQTLRDPRLQDIDLEALLGGFTVTVVDGDRQPVPEATVHARRSSAGEYESWKEFECGATGVARVRVRAEAVDVVVTSPNHRFATASELSSDHTFVLEKAQPTQVTLRLSEATPLPDPPFELTAELSWAGPLGSSGDGDMYSDDPRGSDEMNMHEFTFGADRVTTIPVRNPGRYRVTLWIWKREMSSASGTTVSTTPEVTILTVPGDGSPMSLDVAADAEELERSTKSDD